MSSISRRSFLRASTLAAVGIAAAGPLASCGRGSSAGNDASATSRSALTMQAAWINDAEFMGYYIADSLGYYEDEGLDFTYLPGGPSVIPESTLLAGQAHVSLTSPDTTIKAIADDGAPFVIVGAQYQKNPIGVVSLRENGIAEPADLVGRTLAVPDANRLSVEAMLELNGIALDAVTIVPYTYDPTPLIQGEIDASIDFTTNVPYTIEEQGADPTSFLLYDYGFAIPNDTIVVTRDVLENKRDAVVAWMRASRKGWEENFVDPTRYPTEFENTWFADSGRTIANEEYFNQVQKELIEAPAGIFSLSDETVAACIETLSQIGIAAETSMFDTSLLDEI